MRFILGLIFLFICSRFFSQKLLDLHYYSFFGKEKSFQFFNNSSFSYKQKGNLLFKTRKLVNMQDSTLIFDNDSVVKLDQIKQIRIKGILISPYFLKAGVLFPLVDMGNNLINGSDQVVRDYALYASAFCFAGGFIAHYFQNKHVRIRENTTLRIIDNDYQNLKAKK